MNAKRIFNSLKAELKSDDYILTSGLSPPWELLNAEVKEADAALPI